ncbi:hypothetical protein [Vibrio cyclitrophicus]|uniref:hypothetical protein n=1 Tax=Vibrio cyclitrophicus TaxID=47951 RepID=UPI0002FDEC8F|nr:hypothetical protein [Vibrio cyclitrophicus]
MYDSHEDEYRCSRCGTASCDGLTNCSCGEDMPCNEAKCSNCTWQDKVEQWSQDLP